MTTIANTIERVALFHRVNGDDEVAALIAAAPDLLSSIEYVLPWLYDLSREWEHRNRDNHGGVNRAKIVINNLTTAIAKARGEG